MIKKKFVSQPQAIASYDYTDIGEGTGINKLYCFSESLSGSTPYGMSTEQVYSYDNEKWIAVANTALTKIFDFDFDLNVFNYPKILKGSALVSVPFKSDSDTGYSITTYIIAKVRKWDGSSETEIANATTPTIVVSASAVAKNFLIPITIPETNFERGNTLRLTIEVWTTRHASATGWVAIGMDPQNRDGVKIVPATDLIPTTMVFHAPFKLTDI